MKIDKASILFLIICSFTSILAADQSYEIMQKHFARKSAQSCIKQVSLLLIDKKGRTLNRSFIEKSISKDGKDWAYIEVTAPSDIAGVRLLSKSDDENDEQRLYLPSLKKVKRISGSGSGGGGKGGRFLGSDICYYDIESKKITDATYTYLREEKIDAQTYHVIEATPKDKSCPYGKNIFFVRSDNYFIYKTESYHKKTGKKIKEMQVRSIKTVEGVDFIYEMVIKDLTRENTTLYKLHSVDTKSLIQNTIFTLQYLER